MSLREPPFTVGIEEEYLLVDRGSGELANDPPPALLERCGERSGGQISPEFLRCQVEVGTQVARSMAEARADLARLRGLIVEIAADYGLAPIAASTHPFARVTSQVRTDKERYFALAHEMQATARRMLICGMHVHVGIDDDELRIDLMNQMAYFLPHLLALSTNSPFWLGMNTGLKSYRCKVFDKFPRTNIPDTFTSWADYESFVNLLIRTNCIDNAKKIWWDVRPHPFFPTLEFRICDLPSKVEEVVTIAALFQAIIAKLYKLYRQNMGFRLYRRALIQENKWRAVRYGLDGKMIDFGKQKEVPTRDLILELLDFIDDVVDELGSRKEIEYVHTILQNGTSADRQLRRFEETGELTAVVDGIMAETVDGVIDGATLPGPQLA